MADFLMLIKKRKYCTNHALKRNQIIDYSNIATYTAFNGEDYLTNAIKYLNYIYKKIWFFIYNLVFIMLLVIGD